MLNSLGQVLPQAAQRYGSKTALVFDGQEFSFSELNDLSDRLASGLTSLGIAAGDRVTLYAPNSWEWIVSYYAVLKLGGVINPINVMLTPEEVEFVVRDCGAKAVLASRDKGEPILGVKDTSDVAEIILFGDDTPAGARSFDRLIADNAPGFKVVDTHPDALSTICYTSGTTGHPKGAMLKGESVILNTAMTALMHMRSSDDTVVSSLPCAHVYGNVIMNGAFFYGMTLVLHARFDAADILASIQKHKATMFEGVPTMYLYLLSHPDLDAFDLSSLTRCTVGGQTMAVARMQEVERRLGCALIELWGMTEIAGLGTTFPLYGPNKHGSIGIALPFTEVRIAAIDDADATLGPGEDGELMVRGPLVMLGYYGNEDATAEAIESDGWLHTGDLASMDEDGCVFIVDRKKDMILTAGFNVYPAELERVIAGHPSVALVAVGPVADEVKGELAKAYVVLRDGAEGDADAIVEYCREHLAAYKVPRAVQFVDDLPKTSTGKIMRRMLHTLDA
ncbi:MAG: class I adenylate-forming enzyme family protein [Planctomycetota bacterium]|jgi:long-chain acyl-CoA synthetase